MREKRFFTLSFPVTLTLLLTSNLGKICGTGRMDWVPPPWKDCIIRTKMYWLLYVN